MDKEDKVRVAITSGIAGVILLIAVLYIALGGWGKKSGDSAGLNGDDVTVSADSDDAGSGSGNAFTDGKNDSVNSDNSKEAGTSDIGSADKDKLTEDASSKDSSNILGNATSSKDISGNYFYEADKAELRDVYKKVKYDIDAQMSDLLTYWKADNMAAVRDLVHMDRYEAMSYSLSGTADFYYCGDVDSNGLPNGLGVAVYANDQYYYGEWSEGKRNGNGSWFSFYPAYNTYVVVEHLYSGLWSNDVPSGQGHEHYDYDSDKMNGADLYLQNAIGEFSNGFYNGEMYIMTVDKNDIVKEWNGNCSNGEFSQIPNTVPDKMGYIAVLNERENEENHIWMSLNKAKENGVRGLISGGKRIVK